MVFESGRSQSFLDICPVFVDKTLGDIKVLNEANGNKLTDTKNYNPGTERALLVLEFKDGKDSIYYSFYIENDTCTQLVVWTHDEFTGMRIKSNIEKKSRRRFKKQVLLQKSDKKYYVWNYIFKPDEYLFFCSIAVLK